MSIIKDKIEPFVKEMEKEGYRVKMTVWDKKNKLYQLR